MAQDEGAAQTALIMSKVKDLRRQRGWSAETLAAEMTKAGVPWDRSIVTNLELGRRKSLRVHELIALAYVLDADSPLDLLVPMLTVYFPVTPTVELPTQMVRQWCWKEIAPLRAWSEMTPDERAEDDRARAEQQTRLLLMEAEVRGLVRRVMDLANDRQEPSKGD